MERLNDKTSAGTEDRLMDSAAPDYVDGITAQWAQERPDLDVWPMDVIGRIRRLASMLNKRNEEVWARFGLHGGLFDVLAALRRAGPPYRLSPTELYNSLLTSSGAMTHRLARLSAEGLIVRVPDSHDGRSLLVELTEQGHEAINQSVEAFLEAGYETLSCFDEDDRTDLTLLLRKLLVELGDTGMPEFSQDSDLLDRL